MLCGERTKTPCHLNQNALTFGLKHQGVSCQKTNALPAIYVQYSFPVQNFRNFKLVDIERVSYEVPLWTSFLFVIVILHVFSRPDCTLWYYRLSGDGTSSGNFILINLIYNKFEVPEEDFRFLFFLLYIIIRCSISALCKVFENYVLRHILRISDLREKKQKVYKKMLEVFGRYVVKQYFCTRFRERNADELKCWTKLGNTDFHFEKNLFRKKLQKSFGGSKISFTFASAFRKERH